MLELCLLVSAAPCCVKKKLTDAIFFSQTADRKSRTFSRSPRKILKSSALVTESGTSTTWNSCTLIILSITFSKSTIQVMSSCRESTFILPLKWELPTDKILLFSSVFENRASTVHPRGIPPCHTPSQSGLVRSCLYKNRPCHVMSFLFSYFKICGKHLAVALIASNDTEIYFLIDSLWKWDIILSSIHLCNRL